VEEIFASDQLLSRSRARKPDSGFTFSHRLGYTADCSSCLDLFISARHNKGTEPQRLMKRSTGKQRFPGAP
jgi:hypothetical protein